MGFWARLFEGLRIVGTIIAFALQLDTVGASIDLPPAFLTIEGRRFRINSKVTRES